MSVVWSEREGLHRAHVFIVEHDEAQREIVARMLQSWGLLSSSFACVGDLDGRHHVGGPSCLVLELDSPRWSGLELQGARTAEAAALMPIVFIARASDVPTSVQAMKSGAVDVLLKPIRQESLRHAVEVALRLSAHALEHVTQERQLMTTFQTLTPREREVMSLVCAGLLNKQVASEMSITEITVKAHRGRVMAKMNARSFADLVHMASRLAATAIWPMPTTPSSNGNASVAWM